MTIPGNIELYKPSLSELNLGDHSLPVPVENDAIQLNVVIQGGISMSPLLVRIEEGIIDFSRELDQKLQIHNNARPVGSPRQRGQTKLLARPVKGVALHSSGAIEGWWRTEGDGLKVENLQGFHTFLSIVFRGIYQQQHPDKSIAEIIEIFDEYPDL